MLVTKQNKNSFTGKSIFHIFKNVYRYTVPPEKCEQKSLIMRAKILIMQWNILGFYVILLGEFAGIFKKCGKL